MPRLLPIRSAFPSGVLLALVLAAPTCAQRFPEAPPVAASGTTMAPATVKPVVASGPVAWHGTLDEGLAAAGVSGKKVMIFVYASWCPWCRRFDAEVYPAPEVQAALAAHFEPVRLDGEDAESKITYQGQVYTYQQFAQALGMQGYPTTAFMTADGQYLTRLPGFAPAAEFSRVLRYVGSDAFRTQPYADFARTDSLARVGQ